MLYKYYNTRIFVSIWCWCQRFVRKCIGVSRQLHLLLWYAFSVPVASPKCFYNNNLTWRHHTQMLCMCFRLPFSVSSIISYQLAEMKRFTARIHLETAPAHRILLLAFYLRVASQGNSCVRYMCWHSCLDCVWTCCGCCVFFSQLMPFLSWHIMSDVLRKR